MSHMIMMSNGLMSHMHLNLMRQRVVFAPAPSHGQVFAACEVGIFDVDVTINFDGGYINIQVA